ncbi:tetratricopeptide repeat protein [Nonomuraea sp. NEAU-A123]|uniref:tetratricopeptide repeat protein n=1 Tax=Nonomuraea sp. NEAU-A123 TaxID=2839649 RepID=UPI001BE4B19B|nr:tetratricopeptide repeat protein [Nonomuraea sp. NEAU-A123]MBT2235569.1 LysM peptidoglycan-binding domain-containing protein [Nonomuraea sp. NEAU-A123]
MMVLRLLRALAASAVLLAVVVGFPVMFYKVAGLPLPDHLPSQEQIESTLAAPDDGTLFVAALELVAWGAWAAFSFSVSCEIIANVRGRRLVPQLPGLRGMQRLAAYLVASASLAVIAPSVSNAAAAPPVVSMAPVHPLDQPVTTEPPSRERVYHVKEGDSLWKIADKELGTPRRWPKIWKQNAGSRQPEGQTFRNPAVIQPGWKLRLPFKGHKPAHIAPEIEQPRATNRTPEPNQSSAPRPQPSTTRLSHETGTRDAIHLPSGSFVALAYVSGISTAYVASRLHRRRRRIPPTPSEAVTITSEPDAPAAIRELHRAHRQSFAERDEPMPSDGELIRRDYCIDVPEQAHIGQSPDGSPIGVDLEGPGVGFIGSGALDVIRYLVVDLLRQSSNYRTQVLVCTALAEKLFGIPEDDLQQIAAALPGLVLAPSHESALRHFEETFFMRRRMVVERESSDIGELRQRDPGEVLPAVLLITELDDEVYEHVTPPLTCAQSAGVGAMFLGPWPGGTTCDVSEAHRVETAEGRKADLFAGAQLFHITREEAAAHVRQLTSLQSDLDEAEPPSNDEQPDWPSDHLVRLAILGHPTVHARKQAEPVSLSWLQLNTLTYLALNPNGVTRDQLATALWPDDLGKDIHNALRHLRNALVAASGYENPDPKKAPFISASTTKDSAVYRLDSKLISVDLWDYEATLEKTRTASNPADRLAALSKSAELCTGELAQGLTAEWIEDQRYPLTRSQADVLSQLAELLSEDDAEQALSALERARKIDPDTEETYFRIIRLQLQLERRDDASRTAELLRQHQRSLGLTGDSRTESLLVKMLQT